MNPVLKTAEFWTALVANVIGMVVLFGGITQDQGSELSKQVQTIVGAVISILTTFGYVNARTTLKTQVAALIANQAASDKPAAMASDRLADVLKDAGI